MALLTSFPSPSLRPAGWIAAAALLSAGAAWAAGEVEIVSLWDIQPSETWTAPHEVGKDEVLVEPAILPKALIEIIQDVPGGAGGFALLSKGDLLYRLSTTSGAVYCTIQTQAPINAEARFGLNMLVCLVDAARDGTFEGHFRRHATPGVPVIFGSVPPKLKPLGPLRYEARPPAALAGRFTMRIKLDSDPAKARLLRFSFASAEGASTQALTATAKVANGPYPQRFEALGGYFELTGVNGGKAVIRMISPTTPYPFMMESDPSNH